MHNTGNPPLPAASTSSYKLHGESIKESPNAKRKVNKKTHINTCKLYWDPGHNNRQSHGCKYLGKKKI